MTCLDFLSLGYEVHVLADGVSSSNKEEIPIAFDRLRQAGVVIATSESVAFQLQGWYHRFHFLSSVSDFETAS